MTAEAPLQQGSDPPRRPRFGLSGKLLVLTILFVMITEVLVYVPSIANFRLNWLNDRLAAARTAALVLDAAPSGMVPESLTRQLLSSIGAKAVAMKMGDQRRLLAISDTLPPVQHDIDMRNMPWYTAVIDAFEALLCNDDDIMRVVGAAPRGGEFVEIVLNEAPLRDAMLRFSAQRSTSVAVHLRRDRRARLPLPALSVRAADAADHGRDGGVPAGAGEPEPHHGGFGTRR